MQARRLPGAKAGPNEAGERQRKARAKPLSAAELEALLQRMLRVGHGAAPDNDEGAAAAAAAAAAATAAAVTAAAAASGGEAAAPSAVEYFKASQKQGGGGAAAAVAAAGGDAAEDAAAGALLLPKTPKELGRGCDYILAALLLRAPPALAARWARPFELRPQL